MRKYCKSAGFSTIELLVTILVMGIVMAITILQMQPAIQQIHASTAAGVVLGQLRLARQMSIAHRRDIQVQFIGTNEIKLTEQVVPGAGGAPQVLSDLFLNPTVNFMIFVGQPDTPEGYGNTNAVEFGGVAGGPPTMMFQSNGTFVDGAGTPLNGTVFLGVANVPTSARAITVLGSTGRVRMYSGTGSGWIVK